VSKRLRRISIALAVAVCVGGAAAVARTVSGQEDARTAPSFSVVAGGDVLIHPALTAQAAKDAKAEGRIGYDFDPLMKGVAPVVRQADLALCHLDTVVATPRGPFLGSPRFNVPPQIVTTLKHIGYDSCSTASDHSLDQGPAGVTRTLDALDAAGLKHSGMARSAKEAAAIDMMTVHGAKVAQLSYTYGFDNGERLPKDKPWLVDPIDPRRIQKDAHRARAAGADVVIVSLHWGDEDQNEPSNSQIRLARTLSHDRDISLVVGHHAHVVQPFEDVGGLWVAYGLGNAVARHDQPLGTTEEGALAWFRFSRIDGRWQVSQANFVPTLVDLGKDIRVVDVASALADPTLPEHSRARYRLAFRRTEGIVLNRGGGDHGLEALQGIDQG
jgi:Bacterial capsule synthesis protein PGA_cap